MSGLSRSRLFGALFAVVAIVFSLILATVLSTRNASASELLYLEHAADAGPIHPIAVVVPDPVVSWPVVPDPPDPATPGPPGGASGRSVVLDVGTDVGVTAGTRSGGPYDAGTGSAATRYGEAGDECAATGSGASGSNQARSGGATASVGVPAQSSAGHPRQPSVQRSTSAADLSVGPRDATGDCDGALRAPKAHGSSSVSVRSHARSQRCMPLPKPHAAGSTTMPTPCRRCVLVPG